MRPKGLKIAILIFSPSFRISEYVPYYTTKSFEHRPLLRTNNLKNKKGSGDTGAQNRT